MFVVQNTWTTTTTTTAVKMIRCVDTTRRSDAHRHTFYTQTCADLSLNRVCWCVSDGLGGHTQSRLCHPSLQHDGGTGLGESHLPGLQLLPSVSMTTAPLLQQAPPLVDRNNIASCDSSSIHFTLGGTDLVTLSKTDVLKSEATCDNSYKVLTRRFLRKRLIHL